MRADKISYAGALSCSVVLVIASVSMNACKREQRTLRASPAENAVFGNAAPESDLQPGGHIPQQEVPNPYAANAYAISEGQRLFEWYNCSGCHFHGGGGIGPPFIEHNFVYGSFPANIFDSIVKGRPNGMPSWGRRIPEDQVWKLVVYVRSLNGAEPKTVSPPRSDDMEKTSPQ
jgi:cytochrome c oxidase cbb3-type subunit 3